MRQLLFDFIGKYVTLTEEEKDTITDLDIFRSVKKGSILLKAGQKSNLGYFVLKGCIRTFYIIDGEEKTTAFYTEMEGITPHCVISKEPSEYYVSATEDSIITVSNPDLEAEMFQKFPKFETLCRIMSEELLAKQQLDFDEFKTSSPEQRYLDMLHKRPDLIQRVPQHQLASYLGIKPQSLSRLRARLVEKNKGRESFLNLSERLWACSTPRFA
ncbi:MAG: Crp/Fnr family transcriptional regulator [Cyclobacteriaceae bacterium]